MAVAFVFLAIGASARAETIHIFLVGGQSNADGRASLTGLPANLLKPQTDIPFYWAIDGKPAYVPDDGGHLTSLEPGHTRYQDYNNASVSLLGPEVTFGRSMADYYGAAGQKIAIIKFAAGSTLLSANWSPDGTASAANDGATYQGFQTIVTNGLAALQAANPTATLTINGMIWMQGESDAGSNSRSNLYQSTLTKFITDIRANYGANLPFVLGELSTQQTGTGDAIYRDRVRAAQEAVDAADPLTALVKTDSFTLNSDSLHFDNAGQQALGYAFASKMQTFVVVPEPGTVGLLLLGLGVFLRPVRKRLRKAA